MSSKRDLDSSDDELFLVKKIELKHKLISEKISKITQILTYLIMNSASSC